MEKQKQEPQNPDKCVKYPPGMKCKATARLDTALKSAGITGCGKLKFNHVLKGQGFIRADKRP